MKVSPEVKDLRRSMKGHEYSKFPPSEVNVKLNSDDLSVILDCLLNVHTALLKEIARDDSTAETKKKAYDFAYQTEVTYDNIMSKLKLFKEDREDLN